MSYLRVLDHDPDLGAALAEPDFKSAHHRSVAPQVTAGVGLWEAKAEPAPVSGALGLLIVEGLLVRDVRIARSTTVEFLGTGDVVRPWTWGNGEVHSIRAEARWQTLEPTMFALLDRSFALRMAPWPEILAGLLERTTERARSLAVQMTIRQANVDERLLMMLWHLADRWGRVGTDGTLLKLPRLTHGALARLIGASRPTVSTVIGELRDQGRIQRQPDGHWLLCGEPPRELVREHTMQPGRVIEVAGGE